MIDVLPPSEKDINGLCKYYTDLHDTLSRKFENIDITDLNYTLAEMIRKKGKISEKRHATNGGTLTVENRHAVYVVPDYDDVALGEYRVKILQGDYGAVCGNGTPESGSTLFYYHNGNAYFAIGARGDV